MKSTPSSLAIDPELMFRQAADELDRLGHGGLARQTSGLSPVSLSRAMNEWVSCLAMSPGSQARLTHRAQEQVWAWVWQEMQRQSAQLRALVPALNMVTPGDSSDATAATEEAPDAVFQAPLPDDSRYAQPEWDQWPWRWWRDVSESSDNWWKEASELRGLSPHTREQVRFFASRWLDILSPASYLLTNPAAMDKAFETRGESVQKGVAHLVDEWRQRLGLAPLSEARADLAPGQGLAMTPGEVVFRNDLVELIEYAPTTEKVHAEPVLIIPSCIMKFYILDLSPHNSMVRWLVEQGHTVYIVSWRNPDERDALLEFDAYVQSGVLDTVKHVQESTGQKVHLAGYCLGGTFVSMAAASLQAQQPGTEGPLASVTLMAAETDFTEPGEMGLLIDEAQVTLLEDMMAERGFLSGRQMAGSFQFLHARDLVWAQQIHTVLMGESQHGNDLMTWNADTTRLPALMHSQYLRRMYLGNDLAAGRYVFNGHALSLRDITAPMFVVGTEKDHVSPWRSVFKIHQLVDSDISFALTNGGHNAGIVSEPGHQHRHYRLKTTTAAEPRPSPDIWMEEAPSRDGSWWEAWQQWLVQKGSGQLIDARVPAHDAGLGAAPGQYVMTRYID